MKHIGKILLLLLLAAGVGKATAQTQADSTTVSSDSITWSKELEGVVVKAQKQLIKQEIDRIGYDVQADEESKTQTVMDMLRKVPMVTVDGQDNILDTDRHGHAAQGADGDGGRTGQHLGEGQQQL